MNQKNRIIIAVALIAVALIIIGTAAAMIHGTDTYISTVERGYRYLQEGDFNNAILCFHRAIEMDESREDAYYGLYRTYTEAGQMENALATLRAGVVRAGGQLLRDLLQQLEGEGGVEEVTQDPLTPEQDVTEPDNKMVSAVLNTDMLTIFASASYGDYCVRYADGTGTYYNGQYTHRLDQLGATLYYRDTNTQRIIDTVRGVPFSEYLPNEIRLDNVTSLFGVSELSYDTLKNIDGVVDAVRNGDAITFRYSGCDITIVCDGDGMIKAGADNRIVPNGKTDVGTMQYTLSTRIVDATSNAPVMGATLKIYEGTNTFGDFQEVTTDGGGRVEISLEKSGIYTVEVSKNGYITEKFEVHIMSNLMQTQKTFHISPALGGNAIRFVLTWGAVPTDLDSYLVGAASDGSSVAVHFGNMTDTNTSGQTIAELDVDDVSSFGPETTTLYDTNGRYEFFVDDYTNSGLISSSGATVKIYVGSSLYATVTIPAGVADQWHVCTINNGAITVTNRAM